MSVPCAVFSTIAIFSGPGRFTITSVTVGAGHDLINVTFVQVSHVTCDDYGLLSTTTMKSFHIDVHHTMTVKLNHSVFVSTIEILASCYLGE